MFTQRKQTAHQYACGDIAKKPLQPTCDSVRQLPGHPASYSAPGFGALLHFYGRTLDNFKESMSGHIVDWVACHGDRVKEGMLCVSADTSIFT